MYYLNLGLFGLTVGLLGIFYRNVLKEKDMILQPLNRVFEAMVEKGGFLKLIAFPLGYCIYCSTTWIAVIGYGLVYKKLSFEVFIPIAVSHIIVDYYCKYVLGDIYRKRLKLYKELKDKKPGNFKPGGAMYDQEDKRTIGERIRSDLREANRKRREEAEEYNRMVLEAIEKEEKERLIEASEQVADIMDRMKEFEQDLREAEERVGIKMQTKYQDFVEEVISRSGPAHLPINYVDVTSMLHIGEAMGGGYSAFINKVAKAERL